MEDVLKKELGCSSVTAFGVGGGGCISSGQGYMTDERRVFVKTNDKSGSRIMFDGEAASLHAILKTQTVKVPEPIKVFDQAEGGCTFVMEYFDRNSLRKHSATLGTHLAQLHQHNAKQRHLVTQQKSSIHQDKDIEYVEKFGFDVPTCCGFIPQDNTWTDDWVVFFSRNKLQLQLDMIDKEYHDNEARSLWSQVQLKLFKLFKDVEVTPALQHGDLWGGNAAETTDGPVIFDAASFYGHSEYDLGIAKMFGGFGSSFFAAYHAILPKTPGFDDRNELYQLFHYLNHWNHFGSGYRSQSISLLKKFAKL